MWLAEATGSIVIGVVRLKPIGQSISRSNDRHLGLLTYIYASLGYCHCCREFDSGVDECSTGQLMVCSP